MINHLSLLFLTSLPYLVAPTTYYVIPDNYSINNYTRSNTFTLQHYLNNTSKYFVSHNQLHFLSGQYYINKNLVFEEIYNFTLTGHGINRSFIICSSPANIILINADRFIMQSIVLIDCKRLLKMPTNEFYVSLLFYNCCSFSMYSVYVTVSYNATTNLIGIYMGNVDRSKVINVTVQVNILICHNHPVIIDGLFIYYNHRAEVESPGVIVEAFNYYAQNSCLKYSQCAIKCLILTDFFSVSIHNTVFANLSNSSALYYYGRVYYPGAIYLIITNTVAMYNTGFGYVKMFHIVLKFCA